MPILAWSPAGCVTLDKLFISEPHLKTGMEIPTWQDCYRKSRTMLHTSQLLETWQKGTEWH